MSVNIEEYISDEDLDRNHISSKTRTMKRQRRWQNTSKFHNKDEAMAAIKEENVWSFHCRNNTAEGSKTYYRCNKVKRRQIQCYAVVYLLYNINSEFIAMYRTEEGPSHEKSQHKTLKHPNLMTEEIKNLFDLNIKPKKMLEI